MYYIIYYSNNIVLFDKYINYFEFVIVNIKIRVQKFVFIDFERLLWLRMVYWDFCYSDSKTANLVEQCGEKYQLSEGKHRWDNHVEQEDLLFD